MFGPLNWCIIRPPWTDICPYNQKFGYTLVYPMVTLTTMGTKDVGLRVRIERSFREECLEACRAENKPAAQVIREFMREYVAKRQAEAQGSLFAAEPLDRS